MSHSFLRDSVSKTGQLNLMAGLTNFKTLLRLISRLWVFHSQISLFCAVGLCMSIFTSTAQAQQSLGVRWSPPDSEAQAVAELQQFREAGVSTVELQSLPSDQVWQVIEDQELRIYGSLGLVFPTAYTFSQADSSFRESISKRISAFTSHPSVKALQLFEFGAIDQAPFREQLIHFFSDLDSTSNIQTYYSGNRLIEQLSGLPVDFMIYELAPSQDDTRAIDVPADESIAGYRYRPTGELQYKLTPLKQLMQQISSQTDQTLYFEGQWLLTMLERYPDLKDTLHTLSTDSEFIFPVPAESFPRATQPSLPIIIFLLVWATLGYHYHMSPLYRKSLFRYFTGHTFFVNDIFRRHIRSPIPALVIIVQHALLVSAALYAVFNTLWSPLGLKALHAHFGSLFFFGAKSYVIFIFALFGVLLFSLASILWLYFSHRSHRSVTQIMTLFAWPLQLNFLLATGVLALYVAEGSTHMLLMLTLFIFIDTGGSFLIAAWDASQTLSANKIKYLLLTGGLYLVISVAATIWITAFNSPFWAVIDLSLQLK